MKDLECWHCQKFWDCEIKEVNTERCLSYVERPDLNKDEEKQQGIKIDWNRFIK